MEKLKAVRGGHRSAITRLINRTDDKCENTTINNQELDAILQTLERKLSILQNLDTQILDSLDPTDDVEGEIMDTDDYNLHVEVTICRYKEFKLTNSSESEQRVSENGNTTPTNIPSTSTANQNSNYHEQASVENVAVGNYVNNASETHANAVLENHASNTGTNFYHRLPKLDLPTFTGDVLTWQTFWESFETTVHRNPSLTNVQKFSYLKSQIQHEAAQCISGLSLSSANYEQAIVLLTERFGQTQMIINAYMQNLLQLPNPSLTPHSIRTFYDQMESCIRGLESLGQSQDTFGSLLVPIIFGKLPDDMKKLMTREHGKRNWDIRSLREAISKEMYVQETGNTNTSGNLTPTASFYTSAKSKSKTNRQPVFSKMKPKSCIYCKQSHSPLECTNVVDREKRYSIVKQKKVCFNCFGNHRVSECRSRFRCRKCDNKHHTSICDSNKSHQQENEPQLSTTVTAIESDDNASTFYASTSSVQPRKDVLLKTAISPVWADNISVSANILLDEGSQKSFISEALAQELQLKPNGSSTISLAAFGDTKRNVRNLNTAIIDLQTQNGKKLPIEVLIVPTIAAPLQNRINSEAAKLPYLRGLRLAHPINNIGQFEINMLIGSDYYWDIVEDQVIRGTGPTAVKSKLGYLLSGPMTKSSGPSTSACMFNVLIQHKTEEIDLERFWKVESMGVDSEEPVKSSKDFFESYEVNNIALKNNRYVAKLPWRDDFPELPSNYNVTKHRTQSMISKLSKEPDMLKVYGEILADQEKRGFIEKVKVENHVAKVHYIPHHAVKKDSPTTPISIVYDCSCKESSDKPSLKDCLMSIPPKMNDLTGILTRFRLHEYATTTDIEKAFLQIELDEKDRDVTRFFWLSNPEDPTSQLITYRFRVVLFGTTCSPFILSATLMKHLRTNPTHTTEMLKHDLYVDNVLSSFQTEDSLLSFYKESRKLLSQGGFNLRSWTSNNTKLCQLAASENCLDESATVKILGLKWNVNNDTILFQDCIQNDKDRCVTKREILQESSKIFDPLGTLSPVTVRTKILMQHIWSRKFEWDEPLPGDIQIKWQILVQDLKQALTIEIPRFYFKQSSCDILPHTKQKLHVFMDASQNAYGSCAYIVSGNQSTLVMAKNRVAPLKQITLPRLELMGAVLGVRLAKHIVENIGDMEINFWCDSQIVLSWIDSTKPLKTFIANRVKEIKGLVKNKIWRYCPTNDNPADLLTRGTSAEKFVQSKMWMHGPKWISIESIWPTWNGNIITTPVLENHEIEEYNTLVVPSYTENIGIDRVVDIERFSSLKRLLRVTAYVYRFIHNCRVDTNQRDLSSLSTTEIRNSSIMWINNVQETSLNTSENSNHRSSIVRQLKLFRDENNIFRCGGRIDNSSLSENAKYPYLLPTKHPFTKLVILDAHVSQLHSGVAHTVTHLRQNYWIPRIRQIVKTVLRKCVTCRKVTGKSYLKPDPPPLPKYRVDEPIPFNVTGVDFAGPLHIRDNDNTKLKVYLCLFTVRQHVLCIWRSFQT